MYAKKRKIYSAYVSKHNWTREKQVMLLMILNGEGLEAKSKRHKAKSEGRPWHYITVTNWIA